MKNALVLAAATLGLLGASSATQAGQFKNVQTKSLGNEQCISMHSSPQNEGNAMGGSMQIEIFEFITPAADKYRCCIGTNATNRALVVRMINLSGGSPTGLTTIANAGGCTPYVALTSPFAHQCIVATGPNAPVSANAHYTLKICRQ